MPLDLTSFKNAVETLKSAVNDYNVNKSDVKERDVVILRFIYVYDFAIKMLKRELETNYENNEIIKSASFNDLIRYANEKGLLLGNLENWMEYREKRNIVSHSYDEVKADGISSMVADKFLKEVLFLLEQLTKKNK